MAISFLLNEKLISTDLPSGTVLLDFIRYHQHLKGTKIGCREGDCGACTVLCGELKGNTLQYRTMTSCLFPLGNAAGKHIVTIEGINSARLNPLQQAMHDEAATQCGFCTPGIVVSLTGFCLQHNTQNITKENGAGSFIAAIAAVDGNICRCTGYKSIERAAAKIAALMDNRNGEDPIDFLTSRAVLPPYFKGLRQQLELLCNPPVPAEKMPGMTETPAMVETTGLTEIPGMASLRTRYLGGGTDLYVQQHQAMVHTEIDFLFDRPDLTGVIEKDGKCFIGASSTVSDLIASPTFHDYFPAITKFIKLVSSTPIRNMATIAGNFVNASPIGDLSIFFLALDAILLINDGFASRELPLRHLYKGYKTLDKKPEEYIEKIWFDLPGKNSFFNFEKVSKRTHLDIASVNTAASIRMENKIIARACLSAGGVAPVPLFLAETSAFLEGKELSTGLVRQANETIQAEISPISDARGTATYKRLLLKQLLKAHFITMFPLMEAEEILYT